MSYKILIFLSYLLLISETVQTNQKYENKSNSTDDTEIFPQNPYLTLHLPPWSRFDDVKKKYTELFEKESDADKLKVLTQAYDKIKDEYIKNNKKEKTIFTVIKTAIWNTGYYEIVLGAVLLLTWLLYKLNRYGVWLVISYVAVDKIIPHWFDTMSMQYIASFIIGTVLYLRSYILNFICPTKKDNSGKKKRIEKIE